MSCEDLGEVGCFTAWPKEMPNLLLARSYSRMNNNFAKNKTAMANSDDTGFNLAELFSWSGAPGNMRAATRS